ncbi:MAG: hypothetical protein K0S33_3735 [Bacteroidetes bacterium]|jgi:hypothetical protein|nr:hypothetical protein [Bacteroidota bacterium]
MNTELALAMIKGRMRDMRYGTKDYTTTFKHCVLQGAERREIEAYNELYFLEHDPEDVSIRSDFGFFDLSFPRVNELKYEHQGVIQLQNLSASVSHVRFIQVILKQQAKQQ